MIRLATLDDIGTLMALGVLMAHEAPVYSGYIPDHAKQRINLESMISHHDAVAFMAIDGSGMLLAHIDELPWFDMRVAFEDVLFVKKESRRSGCAIALICAFEAWAKNKNVTETRLGASSGIQHGKTVELFAKMGYSIIGTTLRKEL